MPLRRPLRPSCRVGFVVAALLVTLGGLRLLDAAEPTRLPSPDVERAVTTVLDAPWPAALPGAQQAVRAAALAAVVEAQAGRIECVPGACGFARVVPPAEAAHAWSELASRIVTVRLPAETARIGVQPAAWFAAPLCDRARTCSGRLATPGALASRF